LPQKKYIPFPEYIKIGREKLNSGGSAIKYPSRKEQKDKFDGSMRELTRTMKSRLAEIKDVTTGLDPEMVLVLETVGSVSNFYTAVKNTEGFSWLVDSISESIEENEEFYKDSAPSGKELKCRLYMLLTNKTALDQLLQLWDKFKREEDLPRGKKGWREIFSHLKDIRTWGVEDRLEDTGLLERWKEDLEYQDSVKFEIEFWFNDDQDKQKLIESDFKRKIEEFEGEVIDSALIEEIKYHAFLAKIPAVSAEKLVADFRQNNENKVLKSESVMFFNPLPQADYKFQVEELEELAADNICNIEQNDMEPVVALFDGLPLQNHQSIKNKLVIDDPEDFESNYLAKYRLHGTSMASLILNGDLNNSFLKHERPIYVRPILKPDLENNFDGQIRETIPEDKLFIKRIHRAVKRLFEEGDDGVASEIKIINFSIGDKYRQYLDKMSSLARLLDWLSWKYKVLFMVSAGNKVENFDFAEGESTKDNLLKNINENLRNSKILSPAESINSITVGAQHKDYSEFSLNSHIHADFFEDYNNLPSPISRFGLGYNRTVKPDILLPGGRQIYNKNYLSEGDYRFTPNLSTRKPPGLKVAFPGSSPGLDNFAYTTGTSNANALSTHKAAELYELLKTKEEFINIPDDEIAVLIKCLLVHYADWNNGYKLLEETLFQEVDINSFRKHVQKFLGYGFINPEQIYGCTERQVTLFTTSKIKAEDGHQYIFPLPESLESKAIPRNLIITLAWFSPIRSQFENYRLAKLYFKPPQDELLLGRSQADWRAVMRGTLQHEILTGDKASVYYESDNIKVSVNCYDKTNELSKNDFEIPYALAVTLKIEEDIDIYSEIEAKVRILNQQQERVRS